MYFVVHLSFGQVDNFESVWADRKGKLHTHIFDVGSDLSQVSIPTSPPPPDTHPSKPKTLLTPQPPPIMANSTSPTPDASPSSTPQNDNNTLSAKSTDVQKKTENKDASAPKPSSSKSSPNQRKSVSSTKS